MVQAEGNTGGDNGHRNGSRRRHATRGVDTSGGIWKVAGVGDPQVDGGLRQERWRGAGVA